MAPEVLLGQNHSFPVDFFAIGIMGYEFMIGERPYIGKSRKEIKHLVLRKQAKIEEDKIPYGWSYESVDFINKCLRRKFSKRLGYNYGVTELKEHEWFSDFNWDRLYNKKLRAPFIPKKGGNYDKKYCEAIEKITETTNERYQSYINRKNFGEIFAGYTYINNELIQNTLGIETHTTMTTNTKQSKLQSSGNLTNNNEKKKLYNICHNINLFKNKFNKNYSPSPEGKHKDKEYNKNNNIIISNKETIKEKKEEKSEKEKIKIKLKEPLFINNINIFNTPPNQKKREINIEKKNNCIHLRIEDGENNKNIDNNNSKNNIIALNNSINNNIKKIKYLNGKQKQFRSTSVDVTNNNFKNSSSAFNTNYIKPKNKVLYLSNITNNIIKKRKDSKYINVSLSNSNRERFYKLRSDTGLKSRVVSKIDNNIKKNEISGFYNSNRNMQKKHHNFIKLKQYNIDDKSKKTFYLPNLNKNSSMLSLYGFTKKPKIDLNNLNININYNFKNDFLNNKNKFVLSPSNKKLKKSESTLFLHNNINSNNNKLSYNSNNNDKNNNKKINFFNPISLRRNFSNISKRDNDGNNNKRNTNSANRN
jgi:hypothetical protein